MKKRLGLDTSSFRKLREKDLVNVIFYQGPGDLVNS